MNCQGIRGVAPIDDENEIGIDIFVELNDSDDEPEYFDEDQFNNSNFNTKLMLIIFSC